MSDVTDVFFQWIISPPGSSQQLPRLSDPCLSSKSINTACAEYIIPRSLTLDRKQLIRGDDIEKVDSILLLNKKSIDSNCPQLNTEVIGVIIIHIHQAMGLEKMDARDASGEYCLFHGYIVY